MAHTTARTVSSVEALEVECPPTQPRREAARQTAHHAEEQQAEEPCGRCLGDFRRDVGGHERSGKDAGHHAGCDLDERTADHRRDTDRQVVEMGKNRVTATGLVDERRRDHQPRGDDQSACQTFGRATLVLGAADRNRAIGRRAARINPTT
jgi:hypothetical protein